MKGTLIRLAVWITRYEQMLKRVASLWSNYNDEGAMNLLEVTETVARVEVVGLKRPHPLFCSLLTGWCREVALAIRASTPVARHPECRARGDARCIWEIRYSALAPIEPGGGTPSSGPPGGTTGWNATQASVGGLMDPQWLKASRRAPRTASSRSSPRAGPPPTAPA
jgi:hypothetical protein